VSPGGRTALRRRAGAWACLAILAVVAAGGCGDDDDARPAGVVAGRTLTIYASVPQQGDSLRAGRDLVRAERLALDDAGDRVGRFRVRYRPLDSAAHATGRWDADRTSVNARTALRDPTTIAYLGETDSAATAVSLPILNEAGILQVSPTSTYVGLTRAEGAVPGEPERFYPTGQRTFGRIVPGDDVQARALVTLMRADDCLGAYVLDDDGPFGQGLAENVRREARAQELDVAADDRLAADASSARTMADRIERSDADCLLLAADAVPEAAFGPLRELAAARPAMRFFAPATLDDPAFLSALGPGLEERTVVTTPTLVPQAYPAAAQRFFRAFRARYGRMPDRWAIYGYEAMAAVLEAIREAGDLGNDRAEVIGAFFGLRDRESVLGTYDVEESGDTSLEDYGANRVRGGRLAFDRVVEPPEG
jgi:branched-chain amino acid transport system substrate-binding protein